jgi:hypothetical protein
MRPLLSRAQDVHLVARRGALGFAVRVDRDVVMRVDFERLRASAAGALTAARTRARTIRYTWRVSGG